MRIAYVINSVEGGGAALPVPAVARVLQGCGAEVEIYALTRRDGRAIAAMEGAGLHVHALPLGGGGVLETAAVGVVQLGGFADALGDQAHDIGRGLEPFGELLHNFLAAAVMFLHGLSSLIAGGYTVRRVRRFHNR